MWNEHILTCKRLNDEQTDRQRQTETDRDRQTDRQRPADRDRQTQRGVNGKASMSRYVGPEGILSCIALHYFSLQS